MILNTSTIDEVLESVMAADSVGWFAREVVANVLNDPNPCESSPPIPMFIPVFAYILLAVILLDALMSFEYMFPMLATDVSIPFRSIMRRELLLGFTTYAYLPETWTSRAPSKSEL